MALGQYFADSFIRRANIHEVSIPSKFLLLRFSSKAQLFDWLGLRWNFAGAFLGSVTSDLLPPPQDEDKNTRSLLFKEFLAAPLLVTKGLYTERKFSGCLEAGDNNDNVGRVIDAYAHHILVDSGGTILMTDLQGTSLNFIFVYKTNN